MGLLDCNTPACLWEDCTRYCDVLQQANVPLEGDWPYLILYLRGLKNDLFLSEVQKTAMQELLVQIFQKKDFSTASYLYRSLCCNCLCNHDHKPAYYYCKR